MPAHAAPPPPPGAGPKQQAPQTRRLYASDWAAFTAWARDQGHPALPASPDTVALFLSSRTGSSTRGTLARKAAAIGDRHRRHGLPNPTHAQQVRQAIRALPRPPPHLTEPLAFAAMAARCPGDLAGLRDRALLLTAAVMVGTGGTTRRGTLDRSSILAIDADQIRWTDDSAIVTDRSGAVLTIPRANSAVACPARALEAWLRASDTRFGPVFRKIDRWGTVEHERLGTDAVRRILARRAL